LHTVGPFYGCIFVCIWQGKYSFVYTNVCYTNMLA
jgi:hypothetical protein